MTFDSKDLSPAELRVIETHKYLLSQELKREVTIDEAMISFHHMYMDDFKKEKMRSDNLEQLAEINKFKYIESEKHGRDLGEEAVMQWFEKYAEIWRQEKESLVKNGFHSRTMTIQNESGLHVRPSGTLVKIARKFDCTIYVHKPGMEHYNFKINGKPFMNVKSLLSLVEMCAQAGDVLDFIAYGTEAAVALDEIEHIVNDRFGEKE